MSTSFFYRKFSCYVLHGREIGGRGGAGKVFYRETESNHPPPVEIDCRQFLCNNPHPPNPTLGSFCVSQTFHKQRNPTRSNPSQKLTEIVCCQK